MSHSDNCNGLQRKKLYTLQSTPIHFPVIPKRNKLDFQDNRVL